MMKLIKQESQVNKYALFNSYLLLNKVNSFEIKDTNDYHSEGLINTSFWYFKMVNDMLFAQPDNGEYIYIYNVQGKLIEQLAGNFFLWRNFAYENTLYVRGKENGIKTGYKINLNDFSIAEFPNLAIPDCHKNGIAAYYDVGYLSVVNIETQKENFKIYLDETIDGNFYLYNDVLVVSFKNRQLVGFSSITGKKLWDLENCFNYYNLDESTGLLYGYGGERFEVIDAVKGKKVVLKQFEGSMKQHGIFVPQHMHTLSGDGLYFTSNERQIKFGKINIQNYEIEFVQELIEDKERIGRASAHKPICHNGRLYILDSVETLHIFEEEK